MHQSLWKGWVGSGEPLVPIPPWWLGQHRLPPHFVVVAHHPLDVEQFVAQGFGLQLLRLVVRALKGSTGPASAAGAVGRGLRFPTFPPSRIAPSQPCFRWDPRLTRFRSFSLLYSSATSCKGDGQERGSQLAGTTAWSHKGGHPTGTSP